MNFTIRTRINLFIAAGLGAMIILISISLLLNTRLDQNLQHLAASTNKVEWVPHLQLAVEKSLMPANDYLIHGNTLGDKAEFSRLTAETEDLLGRIDDRDFFDEEERVFLSKIWMDHERLKAAGEEIFAISDPVGNAQGAALMEQFDAMGTEIVLYLEQLHSIHDYRLKQALDKTDNNRRQAQQQLIVTGVIIGFLALIFGTWLARSLIQPIRELKSGIKQIAAGHWSHRVDIRAQDELAQLATHFNSMTEKLVISRRSIENYAADCTALLDASTIILATLEVEQLLPLMSERMARILKTTYCRIALTNADNSSLVIRAAYPIRKLDWNPGIGRLLEPQNIPTLRKAFESGRHILLMKDEIDRLENAAEREQLLTPETQSALILPLFLKNQPQGIIILGETRSWNRELFTPERIAICQTMANQAMVAFSNAKNHEALQEMALSSVTAMAKAIDAKSHWTKGHSERVAHYAAALGARLGLDSVTLSHLRLGCLVHDIGKIGTKETILSNQGTLTDEEKEIMKQHTVQGEEILRPIRKLSSILPVIRHHHERYDGNGYPDGLKGNAIPHLARIVALADSFDAMVADRPYRKASSRNKAIAEIKRCSGTQFDPYIAEVFVAMLEQTDFGAALLIATEDSLKDHDRHRAPTLGQEKESVSVALTLDGYTR
jgi:putative nucleotidyltransferase with HDIG domain